MENKSLNQNSRRIIALLDNLFFAAKINQAAERAGKEPIYAKQAEQALKMASDVPPFLIIVDLDAANCSPFELISRLKADEQLKAIPVVGFVSHVNSEIQELARRAGCDRVLARSVFDRNLVTLLKEYDQIDSIES